MMTQSQSRADSRIAPLPHTAARIKTIARHQCHRRQRPVQSAGAKRARIESVRRRIADGSYLSPEILDAALDRLLAVHFGD